MQALHVLALVWAVERDICLRQRKELLDNELAIVSSKVHMLTIVAIPTHHITRGCPPLFSVLS